MLRRSKSKAFLYVIDGLVHEKVDKLRMALQSIETITNIKIDVRSGLVELGAKTNPEQQLKIACEIAGCKLRTEVKKKHL